MRTLQEIQPGMTLGRYEFLVPIAEGGMASVWAARLRGSRGFSKTVAVKTMLPSVSDDPQFEQMFLDEAQIASRIRHPNVAEILDLGEEDEVLYLVMEWVDGEPLASVRRAAAKRGGFPREIAVRIVADACAGLHAAHELKDDRGAPVGLVHRDISPQNLLLAFDGVVKIVDFGVAKAAGRSSEATTAGQVKGKPPYMSPEQALGEVVDRRTDVFALGIILYQLTTGKHPFRGESDLVTLQNIVSDKPIVPPRAYQKNYPRALDAVVMRALNRDRDRRFQSCAEFEAALEEVFDAALPRARTEDVGQFVSSLLGHKGEERRRALREAISLADDRAAGRVSSSSLRHLGDRMPRDSFSDTPVSTPGVSSVTDYSPGESLDPPDVDSFGRPSGGPSTPFGAALPAPIKSNSYGRWWLAAGVVIALGVAGALASRPAEGVDESASAQASPLEPSEDPAALEPRDPPKPSPGEEPVVTPVASEATASDEPAVVASTLKVAEPALRRPKKKTAAKTAKPLVQKEPTRPVVKPKTHSSFVPPPMTDPGF